MQKVIFKVYFLKNLLHKSSTEIQATSNAKNYLLKIIVFSLEK